jgi:hypothetical protein
MAEDDRVMDGQQSITGWLTLGAQAIYRYGRPTSRSRPATQGGER